jgi:cystathionine gamma-lyase
MDSAESWGNGWEYSRTGNPTRGAYELQVAACENGKFCCAFSSGMAAISAVTHLLQSGDRAICIDDVYGGTQRYFRRVAMPNYGIDFEFMPLDDMDKINKAITPNTKLVSITEFALI